MRAPYTPESFIDAIKAAEDGGYEVLIIDSITHEWSGPGGCLEINERIAQTKYKGNTWSAWNETTPRHRKLLDTIIASDLHIITTLRSKTETVQGEGKKVMKLGMKSEQRDGFEYEMTVVLDICHDGHVAVASKDRTGLFTDKDPQKVTDQTGVMLLNWLNSGAEPAPQEPEPTATQPAKPDKYTPAVGVIQNCKSLKALAVIANTVTNYVGTGLLTEEQGMSLNEKIDAKESELKPLEPAPI
jgi:hypothetical protein